MLRALLQIRRICCHARRRPWCPMRYPLHKPAVCLGQLAPCLGPWHSHTCGSSLKKSPFWSCATPCCRLSSAPACARTWVAARGSSSFPQLGFCPRKGRCCQSGSSAVGPGPAFGGSCRGFGAGQPLPARPRPRLRLNFQLQQNKFPGGCAWSWRGAAKLPACLSGAVSVRWGAAGMADGVRMPGSCHRLEQPSCCLPAGRGLAGGVVPSVPNTSAHRTW